jgi:methionine-gamma-lyase
MDKKTVNVEIESKKVPAEALAAARHELGEHNGINMSIEASSTFTFKDSDAMNRAFLGEVGPKTGIYIYSRHLNPTTLNLGRQIAAIEGTETAYCTASGKSYLFLNLI